MNLNVCGVLDPSEKPTLLSHSSTSGTRVSADSLVKCFFSPLSLPKATQPACEGQDENENRSPDFSSRAIPGTLQS